MKRAFCFCLVLVLLPVLSFSESGYTPKLNINISDFITKYNSIGAPFDSPLIGLSKAKQWTTWDKYQVAWFSADRNPGGATILFVSEDPVSLFRSLNCGIDRIQIYIDGTDDFLSLITVSSRCLSLFAPNIFGLETCYYFITEIMRGFYENNSLETGNSYYRQLEQDGDVFVRFFRTDNQYYFEICSGADI